MRRGDTGGHVRRGTGRGGAGVATAAVVALLLTACGSAPGPAAGGDAAPSAAEQVRTVRHALGETQVTGTPERVVVLDTGELDAALALGVVPVGAVRASVSDLLPGYIEAAGVDPAEITEVGTIAEPDLEAIAALQPDLVLTNAVRHADLYPQLSAIAPTVVAEDVGETWEENLLLDAEALGRTAEAEALLAEHERRAARVAEAFGDPADVEVSVVRFLGPGPVRLYGEGSFVGSVLDDVGLARPALQRTQETFVEVSPERLDRADADLLLHAAYGEEGAAATDEVTSSALWQQLDAVQDGRAVAVDDDRWFLAIGPLGARLVLDDLQEIAELVR